MKRFLFRMSFVFLYYLSWLFFGLCGLVLSLLSALLWPAHHLLGHGVRKVIRRLFSLWAFWLTLSGVVRVSWRGERRGLTPGTVYIANHPSLIDATLLLAHLPDAICIFKPAIARNPALGPAARLAGYVVGDSGPTLIRETARRVAASQTLLIFPEGTRTKPGTVLGPLRPGFALIAARAAAPVQLIVIRCSVGLASKGRAWWRLPVELPAWIEAEADRRWEHDPARSAAALTAEVEQYLVARLRAAP